MLRAILNKLFWGVFRHFLTDEQYAQFRYWLNTGKKLNIRQPETFSEKIQYLKIYDRTHLRKKVADRIRVREYVSGKIGDEYLIPLVGVYNRLDEKTWQSLPEQFALKANHGSGMVKIVTAKKKENRAEIIRLTEKWQQFDYSKFGREWVYKGLPRAIVAEELLLNTDSSIPADFKFFCYHGKVQTVQIDFDRFENHQRNFYDRNFMQLKMTRMFDHYPGKFDKPKQLNLAIELAETLSEEFNFIRVDLYLLGEKIYFGELTNFPGNGFELFSPEYYELHFGSLLRLDL